MAAIGRHLPPPVPVKQMPTQAPTLTPTVASPFEILQNL